MIKQLESILKHHNQTLQAELNLEMVGGKEAVNKAREIASTTSLDYIDVLNSMYFEFCPPPPSHVNCRFIDIPKPDNRIKRIFKRVKSFFKKMIKTNKSGGE